MATTPNGVDAQELWQVQAEAQLFRWRGEPVYPGRLLVLRGESFAVHPVDDVEFNPATERIMGIAIWGACAEWTSGMVRVEDGPTGKSAPVIAGESNRPSTGVGRVDAWIARADALRKLRRGTVVSFGGIPLTRVQLIASVGEVETIVRESAIALLQNAPGDQRPALLALARVADKEHPQDDELTSAILELTASASAWVIPVKSADANDPVDERTDRRTTGVFGGVDNGDTKPPALPAGAEAIDEHDAALLAFLNKSSSLRRKVADVLPEKGPQDRKAVAKRLRKLANRTPPLVDYPRDGRSGVAILPAGAEALKRATAPTPR